MTIKQLYPTQRPSLDLNFAQTKRLDPRITFSRSSTGTYYDASGVLQSAPAGVARFDHNPETGESLGLLVEKSATNYTRNSENLSAWTKGGGATVIVSSNTAVAPDGTTTADKLIPSTTVDNQGIHQNNTISGDHVATFFAKPDGYEYVGFGDLSNNYQVNFYLSGNGSATIKVNAQRVYSTEIVKLPSGWYRCRVRGTRTGASLDFIAALQNNSQNTFSYFAGNGTSGVLIWGIQVEAGSVPTSYIPTTSSTVTRAADVCTVTNSNIYDTDSFTIINQPFGASGGASTLTLFDGPQPIKRATVYTTDLSQTTINAAAGKTDEFWRWRVLGSSFALPNFTTDGQVTVDWGDGTIETLTTSEHTFSNGSGYHDIGFRLNSGTYFRPRINGNATHKDKLIAIGPAPESMKIRATDAFNGCTNLQAFDPTITANGETHYSYAWQSCSSLKNFPLIDTSGVTYMLRTWKLCSGLENFAKIDTSSVTSLLEAWLGCSSLTSFPVIDTSNVTDFSQAWNGCSSLTEFPVLDTSKGTGFSGTWQSCSSLTEFPSQIDVSKCSNFNITWRYCSGLTSFPALDFSSATNLGYTWMGCSSLTSFSTLSTTSLVGVFAGAWYGCSGLTTIPICDYSSATTFDGAWVNCSNLTTIPANLFDTTGTLVANAFGNAFVNDKLSAQSIENLLVSLVANGATGVNLGIQGGSNANTSTWSTAANNAYLELVNNRGWTITQNGTAPT